jgi:hypothetical protein
MNDPDNKKGRDDICCDGGDCCATKSPKSGWKTIVFTFIIVLALGVAGYSLFLKDPKLSGSACDPATCTSANCAAPSIIPSGATTGIGSKTAVMDFDEQLVKVDVAIILFVFNDDQISRDDFTAVKEATRDLDKRGVKSLVSMVSYGDPLFKTGLERFGISRLPALVLHTKSGSHMMVAENLSIDTVLNSYDNIASSAGVYDKTTRVSSGI